MSVMQECSVVIVSYQSGPIIFATIKRALAQANLAEIIVVDNGNAPHTLSRLQQMMLNEPRLKLMSGHGNAGIAKACNMARAKAVGEYILFMHPDCLLPPDALKLSMAALAADASAMVAGAWLLNGDGTEQSSDHAYELMPKDAMRHLLRLRFPHPPMSFVPGSAFEVAAVPGAFLFISAADLKSVGGFDEDFFLCVEDLDLCRRVREQGRTVIKMPQVPVVHLHGTTGGALSSFIAWQRTRGLMHYYKKHDCGLVLRMALIVMLLLNYAHHFVLRWWCILKEKLWLPLRTAAGLRAWLLQFIAMGLVDLQESVALEGRRVLLTGATGQVGVCALRRLVAQGASVLALTRQEPLPYWHERVQWVRGDLSDVEFQLPDVRLDVVVHCAPLWHLPKHVQRLAGMGVTRVVAFGSTSLFSKASSKNWHEKELVDTLRAAEKSVEELCAQGLVRWTILRPTLVYGLEMDWGISRIMRFIQRLRFFPVYPPAQGKRHPVHADDLAKAALQVLDNAATYDKAYNLSGRDVMTFREMVERIFVSVGVKKRVVETTFLPFALDVIGKLFHKKEINAEIAYRMNDDLIFFHDAATQDFGYAPRGFLSES